MRKNAILASALSVIGLMAANTAVAAGMAGGKAAMEMSAAKALVLVAVGYCFVQAQALIKHSIDYGPAAVLFFVGCAAGMSAVIMFLFYVSPNGAKEKCGEPVDIDASYGRGHLGFKGCFSRMTAAFALLGMAAAAFYGGSRLLPTSTALSPAGVHADLDADGKGRGVAPRWFTTISFR